MIELGAITKMTIFGFRQPSRHYAHQLLAEYVRILEKVREMRNLAPFQIEFGNSVPIWF